VFTVRAETVMALFHAQPRNLQGVLRLDISSRTFPPNPGSPCAWTEAQVAVAERLLRLLAGYADEKVLEWDADHRPENFKVITDQDYFVEDLTEGLHRIYGLDPGKPSYKTALQALAHDLFDWASSFKEEAWERHHLSVDGRDVYVEGRPYPVLTRIEHNAKVSIDLNSSELGRQLYHR
jgi:hypothetical protein